MRPLPFLLFGSLCLGAPLGAVTATSLASFEGMEQPSERFDLKTHAIVKETYTAITDLGGGAFRMALRYDATGWDGDRDTGNRDRQRAEVKGLGPHQKIGETFDYETTWRVDAGFHGTPRFFHVFQVKATEGDDGAPMITMTLGRDPRKVTVRYWTGQESGSHAVREFAYVPGEWQTVRIRVKPSFTADGEVQVSVNGDAFSGVSHLALYRPDARDYRPKWGMYRGVIAGMTLTDDYVEHRNVSANRVSAPLIDSAALETEAMKRAAVSVPEALQWLESQPMSPALVQAMGTVGTLWVDREPTAALAWAMKAPVGDERPRLILRLYDRWQTRDIGAAVGWLGAQSPDPDLDPSLWYQSTDASFRHQLKGRALARLAALISDPAQRGNALAQSLSRWVHEDGATTQANEFVAALPGMTDEQKAALRDRIDPRATPPRPTRHGDASQE